MSSDDSEQEERFHEQTVFSFDLSRPCSQVLALLSLHYSVIALEDRNFKRRFGEPSE
ncbi:MAG: hypothetical protein OSB70_19100 [Myxococcota bacterium]|nr:hypothetical protein [Myxococcota bacterium]